MQIRQFALDRPGVLTEALEALAALDPQLLLVFGSIEKIGEPELAARLAAALPGCRIAGCSTAGEISADGVLDQTLVLTAVRFEQTRVALAATEVADIPDSHEAGSRLAGQLQADDLQAVLLFGPGIDINGSALIAGLAAALPAGVGISGGLAGDGGAFAGTLTLADGRIGARLVVAVGLYGTQLRVSHGSCHGWEPFGPARRVTRSVGNLLYELDGEPALEIYKRYLGDYARDLPASGLLFPFEMLGADQDQVGLIRTILGVDETDGMLVLAGEVIEDGFVRLMHASTDSLVDGAEEAASRALAGSADGGDALAILVSCVGRKLVMGARVDEEIEAVADLFGRRTTLAGFYSYGEMAPDIQGVDCKLHNQTMTVTYLSEPA